VSVAALVLAAGAGTRIGGPKALLALADTTFVERVVATARAAGLAPIVVVVGHAAQAVADAVPPGPDVTIAHNPHPDEGQLSSLQVGLAALPPATDLVAWPVDHPRVSAATVRALVAAAAEHPGCAIVPSHHRRAGHPTLFPAVLVPALRALPLAGGARQLFAEQPQLRHFVDVDDAAVVEDIDTREDYARLIGS
jgi:CTP:molybdopterin cytidylyltransferase MocA